MRAKRKSDHVSATKQLRRWHNPSLSPCLLLLWVRGHSVLFSPLSHNITREISAYLTDSVLLPGVYEDFLYVVNVRSKAYRSVRVDDLDLTGATFSPVDRSNSLCVLLSEDGYRLYWLDMCCLSVVEVGGHILCMQKPSVCAAAGAVYMFRGSEGCKLVSEKCALGVKQWTPLDKFSIYYDILITFADKGAIYIGQRAGSSVYYLLFNTITEDLSKVISLSSHFSPYPGSVHVAANDKQLLCLTEDFDLWLWNWQQFRVELLRPRNRYAQSPSTKGFALLLGREMYWLDADQPEVHCFHTQRLEWKWCKLKQEKAEESGPDQGNCCVNCSPF